jgi:cell wall-associated NlpC family hydrolase
MSALDRRVNAYRPDLAAVHLRGQVEAARFVEGTEYAVIEPVADVRRAPSHDAALHTQAFYGERVTVYEMSEEGWAWGQLASDGYVGYLPANALAKPEPAPTHSVIVPRTLCFPAADIKKPPLAALPMGAKLTIARHDERFAVASNGWHLPATHVAPLGTIAPDFVAVAEQFVGTPYLWGGKSTLGIDCSGLVQVALTAAGITCPRDSDMQEAALGRTIAAKDLRRGDLLFWPGHVAIAYDAATILHANAHHMMVAREPVRVAIARIEKAGSALRSVKRVS